VTPFHLFIRLFGSIFCYLYLILFILFVNILIFTFYFSFPEQVKWNKEDIMQNH